MWRDDRPLSRVGSMLLSQDLIGVWVRDCQLSSAVLGQPQFTCKDGCGQDEGARSLERRSVE